jgi:uncharacterized membrane protein YagU involved in acid resistance
MWTWLCIGALVAGTFDISYATGFSYLRSGVPPGRVLRYVASGLLGASAFNGGTPIAILGLGIHFLIAFIVTAIFFGAASLLPSLTRRPLVIGALYGLAVYIVMNYVVLPLSRIGPRPTPPAAVWVSGVLVHMFLIGVPIALAARRAFQLRNI